MKSVILILLFSLMWAEEPSVFEFQDSRTRKEVQNLKSATEHQTDRILQIENHLKQLETSLEGSRSLYDGQSALVKEMSDKLTANETAIKSLQEQSTNNANNIQALKDSLGDISTAIDEIRALLSDSGDSNVSTAKKPSTTQSTQATAKPEQSPSNAPFDITKRGELFKETRRLVYQKKFDEAIARYDWFIEIDYKKAESHYMLGNIAYEQNRYNDAIASYKESVLLDENASYIPRLLLNSANSLRVLNDAENARNFYNKVIESFPNSNEAKEAKTQLNKLK